MAERDGRLARRLAEQFVHRRGVGALESLMVRRLDPTQGAEACGWLTALVGVDAPVSPAVAVGAEIPTATDGAEVPVAEMSVADPWAPIASGLEGIGSSIAAGGSAAELDAIGAGAGPGPGAALIASWLEDLGREQAELGQLAEAWKPAAEQLADAEPLVAEPLADAEPQVVEPQLAEPALAALQASDLMVFGGGGFSAAAPANAAPLSLAEGSFDNPFEAGSLAELQPEEVAQTAPLAAPLTPSLPAQQPDPDPLLRRLQAVATPNGQGRRTGQLAPVPASLAHLRSWLHDDQLPEAS